MIEAHVTIDPNRVIGEVHDHLYGTNLEHIGQSIYSGVWAEMLLDRKFAGHDQPYLGLSEGLTHQNPNFGIVAPWQAVNPHYSHVLYIHDNTTYYTGTQSQRITIRHDDGIAHGIQQSGLILKAERAYNIRLVLRGAGQVVTVRLGDAEWQIASVAEKWQTHSHTFIATENTSNGALQITFQGVGNLWVGCASLMPSDNIHGFRPDVVAAIKRLAPTFLRWPGGNFASAYHWQLGLGDRDLRPSYFDPAWKVWESNDVGMIEFIQLTELLTTEPVLTINMGNGTIHEAADWVEFCNGQVTTPMGALRASYGYPEPFAVKTWFVGNEQFGNWQVGHVDAETYARRFLEFATVMREKDAILNLIGVGVPTDLYGHWNELVLKTVGHMMDELSVHYYSIRTEKWSTPPPADTLYLPKVASAYEVEAMLDRTLDIIAANSNPPVPLAFDEWNTYVAGVSPDFFEDYGIADALYTGALMNACLRRADRIKMSAIFNLINVMGNFRVTPTQIWETPSSLVIGLMTRYRGGVSVYTHTVSPTISTPAAGNLPAMDDLPLVDCAATFEPITRMLYLSLVNRHPEESVEITFTGLNVIGDVPLYRVQGDHPLAMNTAEMPSAVQVDEKIWSGQGTLVLPPHSFTLAPLTIL